MALLGLAWLCLAWFGLACLVVQLCVVLLCCTTTHSPGCTAVCGAVVLYCCVVLLTVLRGAVTEGEAKVAAVYVLDGNGHLGGERERR